MVDVATPTCTTYRGISGGLGIEQNVVTGCIECHTAYDNGSKREEIGNKIKEYLQSIYGDSWNEDDLIYNKWQGFKYSK